MSSSSKKKLQSEAASAKLTARQAEERKEAAKLKMYTTAFVAVMVILVAIAVTVSVYKGISNSGILEKRTTAVTVGDHVVSNAELGYYYLDAVNNFSSTYGSYAMLYGIDTSLPLDEQFTDEEQTQSWADYFIETAVDNVKATYALLDAAKAAGYTLPEEQQANIDMLANNIDTYAMLSGVESGDAYLKRMYGSGASKEGYLEYYRNNILASSYQEAYQNSLIYTDDQIRQADAAAPETFSSYDYNQYYLAVTRFLTGGTTDAEGNNTYSDEERAAAEVAAKAAANMVAAASDSAEDMDAAIAALEINADSAAASTDYTNQSYSSINSKLADWITDSSRKAGDTTVVANETVSTEEDGTEQTTVNGYYVVLFRGVNDNAVNMVNARHILISFEGGTEENGVTVYSDEEKQAAKAEAEELLASWKAGEATEDSFAALAVDKSTDNGSSSNGGLYEDIYPGQMVPAFNDWCFDSSRKAGDTGVVETNYGYHIVYFVGESGMTYRDHLITDQLRDADFDEWYHGLLDSVSVVNGSTKYIHKDIVIGGNQ